MGAQIRAKTSAASDTNINKATPFKCTKLLLKHRGQQLILILLIQTLTNLLQQKRNGLTIIGGPPEELWHAKKIVERVFLQRDALAKRNVSLSKTVSQQKSKVKKLEQENYVDSK